GTSRGRSFAHLALARSLMLSSEWDGAQFYLQEETASLYPKTRAVARLLLSDLSYRQRRYDDAAQNARQAIEDLNDGGALHIEKAAWTALARSAAALSHLDDFA